MDFRETIATRRDGREHSADELRALASGAAEGSIPDYQLSAWLMAAYLNPLSSQETADLTLAMAASGERVDLAGLPKPWVDKHSTGGVGDKTTLVLAPLLAACGLTTVKMSGKGLGITGGTIDKLSSVPGFRLDLSPEEMKEQASRIGLALTGQTPRLAPADGVLYALRDATGTVANVPLIVSSILSKKIAGGAETIVLDVKCGSGAFMPDLAHARELADALAETGKRCGVNVRIAITDMDQPLGCAVGNALEVEEARQVLLGTADSPNADRFRTLCVELAGITLAACGLAKDQEQGRSQADHALRSASAADKARHWYQAQGGDFDSFRIEDRPIATITSPRSGVIRRADARRVGEAVVALGGGRRTKADVLDLHVGVRVPKGVGASVRTGEVLAEVFGRTESEAGEAAERLKSAFEVGEEAEPTPLLLELL